MKIILLPKVQKIVYNHNRPYTKQKYYTQNYNINDEMVELLNYQTKKLYRFYEMFIEQILQNHLCNDIIKNILNYLKYIDNEDYEI